MGSMLWFSLSVSGQSHEGKSLLSIPTSVQDSLGAKKQNSIDVVHINPVSLIFPNYEVRRPEDQHEALAS